MIRACQNALIVSFLGYVLIEAVPIEGAVTGELRRLMDPVGDVTGLWQGRWNLFSPSVDKENNRIEVRIYFQGIEEPRIWSSPDWSEHSCLSKFRHSREIELYDRIRLEQNSRAWESFARYVAAQNSKGFAENRIEKVELLSVVTPIPPPERWPKGIQQGASENPTGHSEVFFIYQSR